MPKRVFWPVVMIVMGLIFAASSLGMLPRDFVRLWPLILIIVGLGGLLTSDREEWLWQEKRSTAKASAPKTKKKR